MHWPRECGACGWKGRIFGWSHEMPLACPACYCATNEPPGPNKAHGVIPDDIPGGIDVPNAICHPDGTPKRYYSKTDIKRALNQAGWTISGDTPKPYRV